MITFSRTLARFSLFILVFALAHCGELLEKSGKINPLKQDGYEVGNGGVVVVCRDARDGVESVELLDFYEARLKLHDFRPSLGPANWDIDTKVAFALSRLARLDQVRSSEYQVEARKFFPNTLFSASLRLPDTKDYGEVPPLGKGCRIEQLAVRKKPILKGEIEYTIHEPYWKKLSVDEKAGLVLHEIVYKDAIRLGQKNSVKVRTLVAVVASDRIEGMTPSDYNQLMVQLKMVAQKDQVPVWRHDPLVLPYVACAGIDFKLDLNQYLSVIAGSEVTFLALNLPSWLAVTRDGQIFGTASVFQVGSQRVHVRASNGKYSADGDIRFAVMDCQDPTAFQTRARVAESFRFDLPMLVDTDFYSKVSGPNWLTGTVGNGTLTGRPAAGDKGENKFVFRLYRQNALGESKKIPIDFTLTIDVTE